MTENLSFLKKVKPKIQEHYQKSSYKKETLSFQEDGMSSGAEGLVTPSSAS